MSYRDILRRNEKLIDTMYDVQDDMIDLANENEDLNIENNMLYRDNQNLDEENQDMKDNIEELHRASRRYGRKYSRRNIGDYNYDINTNFNTLDNNVSNSNNQNQCNFQVKQEPEKPKCPLIKEEEKVDRRAISFYMSDRTKNIIMFASLIFLILLLGLGIDPSTTINYNTILDLWLKLFFDLYSMTILVIIGFILRCMWKKINK